MITATIPARMPKLPQPGQSVCWRDPRRARARCWETIFGAGPFEVARTLDKSDKGSAAGLVVRTLMGEREISEIWQAPADRSWAIDEYPSGGTRL
jgi:hypothetical protein